MTRLLAALTFLTILAFPVGSAPAQGTTPAPDCHGINVTDKAGDSANALDPSQKGSPSSDLIAGFITYAPGADKAFANIQVDHLTEGEVDDPYVAVSWQFSFTTKAGPRYVRAYHDRSGITKFNWGEPRSITDDQTAPRAGGSTTGTLFPGKGGVIQIEMPLKDLGATPGSQLKALGLEVRQWVSLPAAVPSTGLPLYSPAPIYDEASGKGAYTLGPCAAPAAPATTPGTTEPGTPDAGTGAPAGAKEGVLGVKVKVPRLSARKLKKSKKFRIALTGTASKLTAVVRKGSTGRGKALAKGKLAKLKGRGKMTLKGRLKKGTYTLTLTGRNANGQPAQGAVRIVVKK